MDETGLHMISEIASCLFSDNHLNQSKIFAGTELVCYFSFPVCHIQIVNPEGLRDQYFYEPAVFLPHYSITIN